MESQTTLESIEALVKEIGARIDRMEDRFKGEPTCLSLVDAAKRLGVSLSTMKRMVASREIHTATIGKRSMVPVSELVRVSTPDPQKPAQQKAARAAAWTPIPKTRHR